MWYRSDSLSNLKNITCGLVLQQAHRKVIRWLTNSTAVSFHLHSFLCYQLLLASLFSAETFAICKLCCAVPYNSIKQIEAHIIEGHEEYSIVALHLHSQGKPSQLDWPRAFSNQFPISSDEVHSIMD